MEMTAKERIMIYLAQKRISQSKFEKTIGVSNGYLSKLKKSPTADVIRKIVSAFPDLSQEWLITGKGMMLKDEETVLAKLEQRIEGIGAQSVMGDATINNPDTINRAFDEIAKLRELLEKSIDNNSEMNQRYLAIIEKLTAKGSQ